MFQYFFLRFGILLLARFLASFFMLLCMFQNAIISHKPKRFRMQLSNLCVFVYVWMLAFYSLNLL